MVERALGLRLDSACNRACLLLGALLAVVYLIGHRSIGPCIAAHIGLNLFLEPWMIISSATGSWGKRSLCA